MNKIKNFMYRHFFNHPDFSMSFHAFLVEISTGIFVMFMSYDEGNKKSFDIFYAKESKQIREFTRKLKRKSYFSNLKWRSSIYLSDKLKSLINDVSCDSFKSVEYNKRKLQKLQKQVNTLVFLINQKVDDDVEFIKAMQEKNKGLNSR